MGMLDDYVKALQNVPLQEAIPGGAGTTPQGDPTMLSNMLSNIAGLPQRAIQGAANDVANPGSSEAVGPATDAAMMIMGGGMPMAERGALGVAGGRMPKSRPPIEPSHPGYRWEVYDPASDKAVRSDIMTRIGAKSVKDQASDPNLRIRMVGANNLTENENKFLKDSDRRSTDWSDYRKASNEIIKSPEETTSEILNEPKQPQFKYSYVQQPQNTSPRSPTNYIDSLVAKYNSGNISITEGWILKRLLNDRYR